MALRAILRKRWARSLRGKSGKTPVFRNWFSSPTIDYFTAMLPTQNIRYFQSLEVLTTLTIFLQQPYDTVTHPEKVLSLGFWRGKCRQFLQDAHQHQKIISMTDKDGTQRRRGKKFLANRANGLGRAAPSNFPHSTSCASHLHVHILIYSTVAIYFWWEVTLLFHNLSL